MALTQAIDSRNWVTAEAHCKGLAMCARMADWVTRNAEKLLAVLGYQLARLARKSLLRGCIPSWASHKLRCITAAAHDLGRVQGIMISQPAYFRASLRTTAASCLQRLATLLSGSSPYPAQCCESLSAAGAAIAQHAHSSAPKIAVSSCSGQVQVQILLDLASNRVWLRNVRHQVEQHTALWSMAQSHSIGYQSYRLMHMICGF